MKKLRRRRSAVDISQPAPAPAPAPGPSSAGAGMPLYAQFARTENGAHAEPSLTESSRTGRVRAGGSSWPEERVFLAAARSTSHSRGDTVHTGSPLQAGAQVRAVYHRPVATATVAAVAAESRYHTQGVSHEHGHKYAASWDSTVHPQPVSTASAAAAAAEANRHHRSVSSHAAPSSSSATASRHHPTVASLGVIPTQFLETTGPSQLTPRPHHTRPTLDPVQSPAPPRSQHARTSHENAQPGARQRHHSEDGTRPWAASPATDEDSRYNVSAISHAPGAPTPPSHHGPSSETDVLLPPRPSALAATRDDRTARHAGPPVTRDPSSHRERKASSHSRYGHGHTLPTPPPSSTSSIMSPRSIAPPVFPATHPAEVPRQRSAPAESMSPIAPQVSLRASSTQSGPTPRRKYSLLAAFGPPVSKSEQPLPSAADSHTEKPAAHKPPSTAAPEGEANVLNLRDHTMTDAPPPYTPSFAFSPPQSPQRRTHRVPVPYDAPFSSASASAAALILPPVPDPSQAQSPALSQRGLQPSNHSLLSSRSGTPSVKSPRSYSSSLKRHEALPNPFTSVDPATPPVVPPKTPLPPSLGVLPDISTFSPFMRPSDLHAIAPQTPPKMPQEPPPPTLQKKALPAPSPPKPQQKPLPTPSPPKPQPAPLAEESHSKPQRQLPTPTIAEHAPDNSSLSSSSSAPQHGPVRGRPLIFAAMAATETETGELEVLDDVTLGVMRSGLGTAYDHDTSFGHGYPTPRSRSPPLPEPAPTDPPKQKSEGSKAARVLHWFRGRDSSRSRSHGDTPFPVEQKRSGNELPVPEDPLRSRKLSKCSAKLRRRTNSEQSQSSIVVSVAAAVTGARSASVESSPTTPLHSSSSMPQLGSPIQLQRNGSMSSAESVSPSKSVQGDPPQPHRSRSPRDGRGVKVLTKRQVEKLQNRIPSLNNGQRGREEGPSAGPVAAQPPTPITPEEYAQSRSRRRGERLQKARPPGFERPPPEPVPQPVEEVLVAETKEPRYYPLARHLTHPALLAELLSYMSFYEWCVVSRVSKDVRRVIEKDRELTERVLERYLRTVGYARWLWEEPEPLLLTIQDLHAYMRGVSMPAHQYARLALTYLQSQNRDQAQVGLMRELAACCRSFTRIVLRLRAQCEAEIAHNARIGAVSGTQPERSMRSTSRSVSHSRMGSLSRNTSRAPSPSSSLSHAAGHPQQGGAAANTFRSPLFRYRRAPLLQVFVPSPEGDWLSDTSVLECEAELKRAGVFHLMRAGDAVWDTAVGDEGNVGRMLWDGGYLIDLDYTYSRVGEVPHYLPTLAFPPSHFHRVIRTVGSGNPICHIDISPWGEEIVSNLQLLQDKVKTETPQGSYHTVMRWVHRSSFIIRQPPPSKLIRIPVPSTVGPGPAAHDSWVVDPGWYGTVVVEAEGTNEGLADLQMRCKSAFPPRAVGSSAHIHKLPKEHRSLVFRILRERSRPGEIWIRTVRDKERLLPV